MTFTQILNIEDGIRFFRSVNNVILCPGDQEGFLKPEYFEKVVDLKKGIHLNQLNLSD